MSIAKVSMSRRMRAALGLLGLGGAGAGAYAGAAGGHFGEGAQGVANVVGDAVRGAAAEVPGVLQGYRDYAAENFRIPGAAAASSLQPPTTTGRAAGQEAYAKNKARSYAALADQRTANYATALPQNERTWYERRGALDPRDPDISAREYGMASLRDLL